MKTEKILFLIFGVFFSMLIVRSQAVSYTVSSERTEADVRKIQDVSSQFYKEEDAVGLTYTYDFTIEDICNEDTLVFYTNHSDIEVSIDACLVYSMETSEGFIRTSGVQWVHIPLEEKDSGKTVQVVLRPVYADYTVKMPTFLVGSELAIYESYFHKALPELILIFSVVFTGIFLLGLAIYHTMKHQMMPRLYAIGVLAVSAGVWRFSYESFTYFLLTKGNAMLYTLSIVSLMVVALSLLHTVQPKDDVKHQNGIRFISNVYCIIYIGQLILQIIGIFDLRQMLVLTHLTIIVSAAAVWLDSIVPCFKGTAFLKKRMLDNFSWLLGLGVIMDLLFYYFAETSVGMLWTLCAILCFSLTESVRILMAYTEQKKELEAMESRLKLSQTMTMMSQIRSHFVFNILNAISGMCKYDPEMADATIVRFARYLRSNIDIMENDKNIPFTRDLKQLEDYVLLEQVRFGDKVEFYTDIEADQFMIPPLILQPIVENAIKHGVSKKQDNGTIILRTRENAERIEIIVEDDGVGFNLDELDKEKSVGLRNIRFRLEHLVHGTLTIQSEIGRGTTVTIQIPKKGADVCM